MFRLHLEIWVKHLILCAIVIEHSFMYHGVCVLNVMHFFELTWPSGKGNMPPVWMVYSIRWIDNMRTENDIIGIHLCSLYDSHSSWHGTKTLGEDIADIRRIEVMRFMLTRNLLESKEKKFKCPVLNLYTSGTIILHSFCRQVFECSVFDHLYIFDRRCGILANINNPGKHVLIKTRTNLT